MVAAALAAALVSVPAAAAATVPLSAGETKLTLTAGVEKTLRREGVLVKPLGPAKLKGRRLTLPLGSGSFDPAAGVATFACRGGFEFVAGKRVAAVRGLKLDTSSEAWARSSPVDICASPASPARSWRAKGSTPTSRRKACI